MVQILGICSEPEHFAIVLEYLPGGSLHDYLKNQTEPLPLPRVIELVEGIAAGMHHLVSNSISVSNFSIQKTSFTEIWLPEIFS